MVFSTNAVLGAAGFRYDRLTVRLHWLSAALVIVLWGSAQVIDLFPRDFGRSEMRSVHMLLGLVLAGVVAVRLLRRKGMLTPEPEGLADQAARLVHILLLLLLAANVALGVANVWVRGDWVLWLKVPEFDPGNQALRRSVGELHELCANAILVVTGLHAAAALLHHYWLRDGVLRRMSLRG